MDLKILSFNKTLFKKDFNRVKFLVLFIAGVLFATTTVHILSVGHSFNKLEKSYIEHGHEYNREDLIEQYKDRADWPLSKIEPNGISFLIILVMPITLIAILFSEEKRKRTFEVLKVMPYTKSEIFFNKLLVSLVAIILPFVLNGLIMLIALAFSPTLRMFYSASQVIRWILSFTYYQLPILGFTLIFGMLTGNTISHIILTAIFLVFPMGFVALLFWNLGIAGFNSIDDIIYEMDIFFKLMSFTPMGAFDSRVWTDYTIYIMASIIMIIIAKILFNKNKIERSGETLEFENTEGFFKFGVAICTALLMGIVLALIFGDFIYLSGIRTILVMVLGYIAGGILGYLVADLSIKAGRSKG